jgi:hypothetical protein
VVFKYIFRVVGKTLRHKRAISLKQMALEKLVSNMMTMVEPKPRKYKTKKEKDKNILFKESATLGKAMVEDELCEEEVQSLKEIVEEEVTMATISAR